MKQSLKKVLKKFNIGITRYDELENLREIKAESDQLLNFSKEKVQNLLALFDKSKAQLKQDLFVLHHLDFKRDGFFVEFGATNGVDLSNTYLLEKEFGWNGILAEPARGWHDDLKTNRNCNIETDCVWRDSNSVLTFNEADSKEFSTISEFNNSDYHTEIREEGKSYKVNTISLIDLLDKYNAPKTIDYLSIDTEGSEFEILSNFDFNKYSFNVISCEHNFTENRKKIYDLLTRHGYERRLINLSNFDDWFVKVK